MIFVYSQGEHLMIRRTILRLAAIGMIAALSAFGSAALAQSAGPNVDEIIKKHHDAQGGLEKMKAVKSIRQSGKINVQGLELPVVMEQKRPGSFRLDISVQGMQMVQAYDGKVGWVIQPGPNKNAEPMGEDDLKDAQEQADMDGPLVDYKEKGSKVELVGKEPVEGTDAYKIKVTLKSGDTRTFYLDADSWLLIKSESKSTVRGTERETETAVGDYKEVGGVLYPHSIEQGVKGTAQKAKIVIDKIEINPTIEDARFKMPEVKKAEEKKP
jgi:outer membrane lipoprotein-sorting protein